MSDNTSTNRSSGGNEGSGRSGGYGWLDDYQSGNYDNLPHDEIYSSYRDWSRTASPDELYEGTYQGYQNLPQDQWSGAASHLYDYTQQRGLDLSELKLSSPDYQQWNAQDLAHVTRRAYGYSGGEVEQSEEKEEGKESGGGVPKPLIGLALAGALAFAASRIMGGKGDKEEDTSTETRSQTSVTTMDYGTDTGGGYSSTGTVTGYGAGATSDYDTGTTTGYSAGIGSDADTGTTLNSGMGGTSGYSTGSTGSTSGYGSSGGMDDDQSSRG